MIVQISSDLVIILKYRWFKLGSIFCLKKRRRRRNRVYFVSNKEQSIENKKINENKKLYFYKFFKMCYTLYLYTTKHNNGYPLSVRLLVNYY